ncbi:MAG: hypothetical protein AAGF28_08495 [Pseudomonadota bacterium]
MSWSKRDLQARIAGNGHRHRAGSPAGREVECYRQNMVRALENAQSRRVLVLGMTPELRQAALDARAEIVSMELSQKAIDVYGDWIVSNGSETIVQDNWLALDPSVHGRFGAILGDGVFPNLLTQGEQAALMGKLAQCLEPAGRIVMRHPVLPDAQELEDMHWTRLVSKLRNAEICEDAFGLSMRLWGLSQSADVMKDGMVDNAAVFSKIDALLDGGKISADEHQLVHRFRFFGKNLFASMGAFEELAARFDMAVTDHNINEGFWSRYYRMLTIGRERDEH